MRIKFNGEIGSQEIAEHIAKYVSKFFEKYPIKSVKAINLYFNMYNDEHTMVAPAKDGKIIEIVEITDPNKKPKKNTKDNVVQMPVVEMIEITSEDLARKEQEKLEKRADREQERLQKMFERRNKGNKKKEALLKKDFEETRRQNMLMKKQPKKSE